MHNFRHGLVLLALTGFISSAAAQDSQFTPPRLRITTKSEKNADGAGLMVSAVSPMGLGDKLGLQPGDVIKKVTVGEPGKQRSWDVNSSMTLSRCLAGIRDATLNDKRAAPVTIDLVRKDGGRAIVGAIIRAEVPDRIDGGTLYYFKSDKSPPKGK